MCSSLRRVFMAVAVALVAFTLTGFAQQSPGKWITGKYAPLPEPAEEYTSVVSNGKLYLIGGNAVAMTPGAKPSHPSRVLEYDLASNTWTRKKPVPFAGDHMSAAASRGKIYVFGGTGPEKPGGPNVFLNKTWEYDPAADSWKGLAPMPARRTATAAVELGGKIYVLGGNTDVPAGLTVNTNDSYDPATDKWTSHRPMPTPRNHAAAGMVNGKIYVIGGRLAAPNIGGFVAVNTEAVEEYDPATDAWKVMNRMPTARSGHGWITHQGRIYVAGGEFRDYHADAVFRDFEAFDPATNEWLKLPPMPTARHGVNLAAFENRIYAIGGHLAFAAAGGHAMDATDNEVFELSQK